MKSYDFAKTNKYNIINQSYMVHLPFFTPYFRDNGTDIYNKLQIKQRQKQIQMDL